MLKVGFLGFNSFTESLIKGAIESGVEVVFVVGLVEKERPLNSCSLNEICELCEIQYFEVDDINSEQSLRKLLSKEIDYLIACWHKLISNEIIDSGKFIVIGTHPTDLPHNRGRHPLHWMIDLGIKKSMLSFFLMSSEIDCGAVLFKQPFEINPMLGISNANERLDNAAFNGVRELLSKLKQHGIKSVKQSCSINGNSWRKRTPYDSLIDFRLPADQICRLVNSFSDPYPCAKLIWQDTVFSVKSSRVRDDIDSHRNIEPGSILEIGGKEVTVKTSDHYVSLSLDKNIPKILINKKYILTPSYYINKYSVSL